MNRYEVVLRLDLDTPQDVTTWDWRTMLNLAPDEDVTVLGVEER